MSYGVKWSGMDDELYNQFASVDNLRLAFEYVKDEAKRSTLPLDPFWTPGFLAVDRLGDAFFNSLAKVLTDRTYKPSQAYLFPMHKENLGIRKVAMLSIADRVVYQALLNPEIMGNQISSHYHQLNYSPPIDQSGGRYQADYYEYYQGYWSLQREYFETLGMKYRGEYDVHCYFDNVSHFILLRSLKESNVGSLETRKLLMSMLAEWFKTGRGIPQGPVASSMLSNLYLGKVDEVIGNNSASFGYVRYMDDMVLHATNENILLKWVEKLTYTLDELGLVLNSKSSHQEVKDTKIYEEHNYSDYDESYDWDSLPHQENEAQTVTQIISDIRNGVTVPRYLMSQFKHYLNTAHDFSRADEILDIYPKLPSFGAVIAKYLRMVCTVPWIQTKILHLLQQHYFFRWQKLWLAKLIFVAESEGYSGSRRIDFSKSEYWELRSIAWLSNLKVRNMKLHATRYTELIQRAENGFERAIYLSLADHVEGDVQAILRYYMSQGIYEERLVAAASVLGSEDIALLASESSLFDIERASVVTTNEEATNVSLYDDQNFDELLGVEARVNYRKRYPFEIRDVGGQLCMVGSILNGKSVSIFVSDRTSTYKRLILALLGLHKPYEASIERKYTLDDVSSKYNALGKGNTPEDEIDAIDVVKARSNLHPLCEIFMRYFLVKGMMSGKRCIGFRSAIDPSEFEMLPDKDIAMIRSELTKIINPVK